MAFERMSRRGLSTSSCFLEETFFSSEKELGFWKPETTHYCQASCHEEEESFGSMEEMEAKTIGNLLPAEDDLFSGVINGREYCAYVKGGDNAEDFDLFSSVGGMELEIDDTSCVGQKDSNFISSFPNGREGSNGSLASAHSYGEFPSRTLLVRNISSNIEDSELRVLFEQYGDIRNLYTACKHRGFVMISYFDLRAATNAMKALQNKLLRCQKLDIHYSIPKDKPSEEDRNQGTIVVFNLDSYVTNDVLFQTIGSYGEIKEIREIPLTSHHKSIEFYDIRAAEAACRALNKCNIAGKLNKVKPSYLEAASLMHKRFNVEQLEVDLSRSPYGSPSSESMATVSQWEKTVGCIDNSSVQPLRFESHVPLSALTENVFSQGSSCLLKSMSSQLSVISAGNHFGLQKPIHSLDQGKFSCKCIPSFHPHSFGDCQDNLYVSFPHNSSSTVANLNRNSGFRVADRMNGKYTSMVGSNGQPMQLKGGVSDPSGNVTCPICLLHCSNFQHHSSSMAWLNSPLFCNGVGPSCIFSHGGGNFMEKSTNNASPHQMSHICPRQNTFASLAASFGFPHECERNISHKRNQGSSGYADKKQFELDIDRILTREDMRTTLMIKNIPNKYTSKMLLATIDEHCHGTYDFIYLPIDFKNKCNVGYAFINLIDPLNIIPFYKAFNGKKWDKFNSEKVVALAYARIQGKAALVTHFQNSSLMNEDKRCHPILFCTNGPNAGEQEPFPMGTTVRIKAGKA